MAHRTVVIGSSDHRGADCFEWKAPFQNLSDYNYIIVNMTSLDDETLSEISPPKELGAYLSKMASCRREISQRLAAGGLVVVIYESKRQLGGRSESVSNMDWMPIELEVQRVSPGKKLELSDTAREGFMKDYLSLISEYWMEPGQLSIKDASDVVRFFGGQPKTVRIPLLQTAALASVSELIALEKDRKPRGSILAVHPPPEPHIRKGIDRLIEELRGKVSGQLGAHQAPGDVSEIEMPGEMELHEKLERLSKEAARLATERQEVESRIARLRSFVDLLWEWGDPLDERVREAFRLIGLTPQPIEGRENKEDFVIPTHEGKVTIVVEVTGMEGQIDVRKARQLIDWVLRLKDSSDVKGVLVGNHCRRKLRDKDGEAFTKDAVEAASGLKLCLVSSEDLFKVVCDFLQQQITGDQLMQEVISTDGVWKPRVPAKEF